MGSRATTRFGEGKRRDPGNEVRSWPGHLLMILLLQAQLFTCM